MAHPLKTKAIASARIKTDKIDMRTLAHLFYLRARLALQKKLAVSLPMIRTLVASVLSLNRLSHEEALALVSYHLLRNRKAAHYHRLRKKKQLAGLGFADTA